MNYEGRLNGSYTRLEHAQARITPAETVLIIRDMHNRLRELEEANDTEKNSTRGRTTSKTVEEKVSSD